MRFEWLRPSQIAQRNDGRIAPILISADLDFPREVFQDLGGRSMSWGGCRANAGRKPGGKSRRTIAKVPLVPARGHRQTVEEMPLDILIAAARDKNHPIELRLAAAAKAAPYFHAKISTGPPKASFEMTDAELQAAIAREEENQLRSDPGRRQFRVVR
jgi:hypothetical protein